MKNNDQAIKHIFTGRKRIIDKNISVAWDDELSEVTKKDRKNIVKKLKSFEPKAVYYVSAKAKGKKRWFTNKMREMEEVK